MQPSVPEIPLNLKAKGDLAEMMVAVDLLRRGHKIAIPYGEDCDFDLVLIRSNRLERVQVKHTASERAGSRSFDASPQTHTCPQRPATGDPSCRGLPRSLTMEPAGFEPATFRMQTERSAS